jgi:predicted Zn-dependent peptidase
MYHLAHEELYSDHYTTPDEQVARIEAVTRDDVVRLAREFLRPESFALTALGPSDGAPVGDSDWEAT